MFQLFMAWKKSCLAVFLFFRQGLKFADMPHGIAAIGKVSNQRVSWVQKEVLRMLDMRQYLRDSKSMLLSNNTISVFYCGFVLIY